MTTTTYAANSYQSTPQAAGNQRIDQPRFWVGAVLTSTVAALAGVIGLVIAQGLLRVDLSSSGGANLHIGTYAALVGLLTMLAAGLFAGLIAIAPRPTVYFGAITGLVTALAVLLPFTGAASPTAHVALGAINLVVGVLIMTLVPLAAVTAARLQAR